MRYLSAALSVLIFFAVCFASVVAIESLAGLPGAPAEQTVALPRG